MNRLMINLFALVSLVLSAQVVAQAKPDREDISLISVTEVVESVDYETREVVLRNAYGKATHVVAGPEVKRLNEVQAGDTVTVDYFVSVAYELREPSAEEKKQPFVELEETVQASADQLPGEASLRQFKAVCTIEGLDRPTQSVTLKGPKGNYALVKMKNPENLTKLRIGQTVVVTHTEAMAISLQKI